MLAGLSAAGSGQQSMRSVAGQVAFAGVSGACVGAYLMWEFFPGEAPLQVRRSLCPLLTPLKSERCGGLPAACTCCLRRQRAPCVCFYAVLLSRCWQVPLLKGVSYALLQQSCCGLLIYSV